VPQNPLQRPVVATPNAIVCSNMGISGYGFLVGEGNRPGNRWRHNAEPRRFGRQAGRSNLRCLLAPGGCYYRYDAGFDCFGQSIPRFDHLGQVRGKIPEHATNMLGMRRSIWKVCGKCGVLLGVLRRGSRQRVVSYRYCTVTHGLCNFSRNRFFGFESHTFAPQNDFLTGRDSRGFAPWGGFLFPRQTAHAHHCGSRHSADTSAQTSRRPRGPQRQAPLPSLRRADWQRFPDVPSLRQGGPVLGRQGIGFQDGLKFLAFPYQITRFSSCFTRFSEVD